MTNKRKLQLLTGLLALNSLLLGLVLFLLFAAVGCVSTALDQEVSRRSFPTITEWAVNFRPQDLISTWSLVIAVVSTSLFIGLLSKCIFQNTLGVLFYLTAHSCIWLMAGAYFLFFVMAVAYSHIHVYGSLYEAGHEPPPAPSMLTPPLIDSRLWLAASLVYLLVLVGCAMRLVRTFKTNNPIH
jgi:hypothetical protein